VRAPLVHVTDGAHTFAVRAKDRAASSIRRHRSAWTVDAVGLPVAITRRRRPSNATTLQFSFTSTDATATFECQVDGSSRSRHARHRSRRR
jgi:hypothetical protein